MPEQFIKITAICSFEKYLISEEKSIATIKKYLYDIQCFVNFLADRQISKEEVIVY